MTPLEALASRLISYEEMLGTSKRLFDAYDGFIGLLAEESPTSSGKSPRKHLDELPVDQREADEVFQRARALRTEFAQALIKLFLEPNTELYNLTFEFGVF
jgi:hypothetical protein